MRNDDDVQRDKHKLKNETKMKWKKWKELLQHSNMTYSWQRFGFWLTAFRMLSYACITKPHHKCLACVSDKTTRRQRKQQKEADAWMHAACHLFHLIASGKMKRSEILTFLNKKWRLRSRPENKEHIDAMEIKSTNFCSMSVRVCFYGFLEKSKFINILENILNPAICNEFR